MILEANYMEKKYKDNLKLIYGIDLIVFGIVLACHLFIESFNFNNFWLLFVCLPALAEMILNKRTVLNISVFILGFSLLGYFVTNKVLVAFVVLLITIGVFILLDRFIPSEENENSNKNVK